jgi:Asp-tRNA(Asn)/Glu-tRNA(Gln) amidotransferase A subunit family amidase
MPLRPRILALLLFAIAATARAQSPVTPFNVVDTTIAETQAAIREGRTTCRAIVEGYLARIKAYDQAQLSPDRLRLNSIVLVNPAALAEADACDRNFAATHKLPPLGGIAVLIKDNYDTAGLQTTGGLAGDEGIRP